MYNIDNKIHNDIIHNVFVWVLSYATESVFDGVLVYCDIVYLLLGGCYVFATGGGSVRVLLSPHFLSTHLSFNLFTTDLLPCHQLGSGGGVISVKRGFPQCLRLSKNFMWVL